MSNTPSTHVTCSRCRTNLDKKGAVGITINKFDEEHTLQKHVNMIYCTSCAEKVLTEVA